MLKSYGSDYFLFQVCDSYVCPHTIMPYLSKEENKELYKQIKTLVGKK